MAPAVNAVSPPRSCSGARSSTSTSAPRSRRGQSGTHCGVAAADHDDVGSQVIRHQITSFGRSPRNSASTATSPSSVTINGFTSSELIQ